jgi:nucleoside-triphosphatase
MKPVILLTGPPGVGKTTAIKTIMALLGSKAGGFYTQEVRAQGRRTGFEIITLDGRTAWLASRSAAVTFKEEISFGKYRVNLRAIDSIAVPALRRALKAGLIILIDEIGPMEIASELFNETVLEILKSQAVVVGTVMQRPNVFADRVRAHPRVRVKHITPDNRDSIPMEVIAELTKR